jgi:hypothetical protein
VRNNLFIFNFDKVWLSEYLRINRAFLVFIALFIITGVLFIQISYLYEEGTEQIVRIKREWVKQKDRFKEIPGKDTVIFLGNSKITAGLIPELFDRETGNKTHSFNLSLPALPLAPHYFLLRDYLKNNVPPKYIIMTFNPGRYDNELFPIYSIQGAGLSEAWQYALVSKNSDVLFNYIFPWSFYFPEFKRYLKGKIFILMPDLEREKFKKRFIINAKSHETYLHDWSSIFDSIFLISEQIAMKRESSLVKNRGYYFIVEQAALGGELPDDYISKLKINIEKQKQFFIDHAKMDDPFVDKFFSLTKSYGIKVVLISDYAMVDQLDQIEAPPSSWTYLKSKYDNVYFANNGFYRFFYEPKYFSDPVHVNPQGAIRYTKAIAQEFHDIFYYYSNI